MFVTPFAIIDSIVLTGIIFLALKILKRIGFMRLIGVEIWFGLVLICFTTLIPLAFISCLVKDFLYATANETLYIYFAFIIIWLLPSFLVLYSIYLRYMKEAEHISLFSSANIEKLDKIVSEIISETDHEYIKFSMLPIRHNPHIYGFKNGVIIFPVIEYTAQELRFIVAHEYAHYKNHDNYYILFTQILCVIFWWNPLGIVLHKELEQAIEYRCDSRVTDGKNKAERIQYVKLLRKIYLDPN